MSIMNKAQELGDAIVASEEFEALKNAEKEMQADESAQKILQEFQAKQRMAQMAQMNGKGVSEDMQKEIQALQAQMQENAKIKQFMEKQQDFNQIMQQVNDVLTTAMQGEEEGCAEGDSCGGGCC